MQRITPCLWFDGTAEEAVAFYTSVFRRSKILAVTRFGASGAGVSGQKPGSVMTITFRIEGQEFLAVNGGPDFAFTPAISLLVKCRTQGEIDRLWKKLSADPKSEQCGWLKDKFGVSWQIVPAALLGLLKTRDSAKRERMMKALYRMKRLDLAALRRACR